MATLATLDAGHKEASRPGAIPRFQGSQYRDFNWLMVDTLGREAELCPEKE